MEKGKIGSSWEQAEALLKRLEEAFDSALSKTENEGFYVGPFWTVPSGPETAGWKRTVLKRRPRNGATSLGHVFFIATNKAGKCPSIDPVDDGAPTLAPTQGSGHSSILLTEGPPVGYLIFRSHHPDTEEPLQRFVRSVIAEFEHTSWDSG